jgi:hypothetical protein
VKVEKPSALVALARFWTRFFLGLFVFLRSLEQMLDAEGIQRKRKRKITNASSSIGRVAVSKTVGWGFESLLA